MRLVTKNRKAFFEYHILEKLVAGIKLVGSEVKSIRDNKVNISEAFCYVRDGEMFIKNMHISVFTQGGFHNNHEPLRERKLLLNKKEITKLSTSTQVKGLTIIPLAVSISKAGFIKIEIGLARGKKLFDKRASIKDKDLKRERERFN